MSSFKEPILGTCRQCKKAIRGGHLSGPDGMTHWECWRDEKGKHPFSPAGFAKRGVTTGKKVKRKKNPQ